MIATFASSLLTPAAANPVDHVVNHGFTFAEDGTWLWSAHVTQLLLSGLICVLVGFWFAKQVSTGPESQGHDRYVTKNPFAHMIEVIAGYLRDSVVRPMLHERTDMYIGFLWSLFFFILVNNMLGLIPLLDIAHIIFPEWKKQHLSPIGGTATQNIAVTAVLAFFSFIVINLAGIKELGIGGYLKHLTADAPVFVWPILVPIEIIGTFIKPVALAIRLFANMTAGHILMATLFGFIGSGVKLGLVLGSGVVVGSALGALAVYFLEIFVGFLQAFVFMFLTTVFISLLSHHGDHDDEHGHGHAEAAAA